MAIDNEKLCSRSLQRTLSELRQYQEQHKYWMEQQEKLISEQAPLEMKLESRLHYEEYKIRGSKDGRGKLKIILSRTY